MHNVCFFITFVIMELLVCPICSKNGLKPLPISKKIGSDRELHSNEDFIHLIRRGGEHFLSRTRKNVLDETFAILYAGSNMVMN